MSNILNTNHGVHLITGYDIINDITKYQVYLRNYKGKRIVLHEGNITGEQLAGEEGGEQDVEIN